MDCSFSLSNLICNEDATHLNEEEEEEDDHRVFILFSETEDEYIEALVSRESSFESRASGITEAEAEVVLRCNRLDSIKWVLKVSSHCLDLDTHWVILLDLMRFLFGFR